MMSYYRPEWWPKDINGGPLGVAELCSLVHAIHTGSAHPSFSPDAEELWVRCLEWMRDNWKYPSSMWERALLALVVRTLTERKPPPSGPPDIICRR